MPYIITKPLIRVPLFSLNIFKYVEPKASTSIELVCRHIIDVDIVEEH